MTGPVQVGPAQLTIEARDGNRLSYTVWAPVVPHWGLIPKPGARYVIQRGRGPRSEAELRRDYDIGGRGHLYSYRGPAEEYPYRR